MLERQKYRAKLIEDWDRQIRSNLKKRPEHPGTILRAFRTFATDYARKQKEPTKQRDIRSARDDVLSTWELDLDLRENQLKQRRKK